MVKFCPFVIKLLSLNEIKGHNSVTNVLQMTGNNPDVHLININAYIKLGEIQLICSQDICEKKTGNNPNLGLVNINAHTKFG